MYSYEDRVRAVKLYLKLGKRVRATIRQLGYPTKNALKAWHREYDQRLDLPGATRAGLPSTRRRKGRQRLSTTSLTIAALRQR